MLRRIAPVMLLALLLLPATALGSEMGAPKEYVTEWFLGLIVGIMLLFAVIAGFEARRSRRGSSGDQH